MRIVEFRFFIINVFFRLLQYLINLSMEETVEAPLTNSGRMLKTSEGRVRSLSEERIKFMEEEYDVSTIVG